MLLVLFEIGIIKEKPKLPLFLAMRNIYKVKINGICFMLIESGSDEKFGIKAFKKQIAIYEEVFQLRKRVGFIYDRGQRADLHNCTICSEKDAAGHSILNISVKKKEKFE